MYKKQYAIYRAGTGYIIHNTNYKFKDKHTHLKSLNQARLIIDNIIHNKMPKTRNLYLLRSYLRIAESQEYMDKIQELIDARKNKGKQNYYNRAV